MHVPMLTLQPPRDWRQTGQSYELLDDGRAIRCLACGLTSYHPRDVAEKYCGFCHRFHEDPRR
jgi:hypothetical protein